jgi:hypothetical protein
MKSRKKRELEEERMEGMRKDRRRVGEREQQQRHRDKIREVRLANGWRPFQKRVSLQFLSWLQRKADLPIETYQ